MSRLSEHRVATFFVSLILMAGWMDLFPGQAFAQAVLMPNPSSLNLGEQRVSVETDPMAVEISNIGDSSATSISCAVGMRPPFNDPGDPLAFSTSACPTTLAVGASFSIDVTFTPYREGLIGAALEITYDNSSGTGSTLVELNGTGFDGPDLVVNGDWSDVDLGHQHVAAGPTAPPLQVPLVNSHGSLDLTIVAFNQAGADCGRFSFGFPVTPLTLPASTTDFFSATFDPALTGVKTCEITFVSNDPDLPDTVTVTGTGTDQAIVVTPSEHDFGEVEVFGDGVTQDFSISNDGVVGDLAVSSVTLSGTTCSAFSLSGVPSTPFAVAPGGNELITAEFDPPSPGIYECSIVILSDDPLATSTDISLTGTGVVTSQVMLVDRTDDMPSADVCDDVTPNDCSLRGAIIHANLGPAPDEIQLPAGTYSLTVAGVDEDLAATGDLDILEDLTVSAPDGGVTIDASGLDRVFHIPVPATVVIKNISILGGQVGSVLVGEGGGFSSKGNLTLEKVTVSDCSAGAEGGGIYNDIGAWLGLIESKVTGNSAPQGGGLYNRGILEATDSTIGADNTADGNGGGLFNDGSAVLSRSTFSGNLAHDLSGFPGDHQGGGLFNAGVATATNCTFALNQSPDGYGGAIFNAGTLHLKNITIADNLASGDQGSAIGNAVAAQIETVNTLLEGSCFNLGGVFTSFGGNLESPGNTCTLDDPTDQVNVADAGTGELCYHGGHSRTFALEPTSPAIDAASNALCAATDQREIERPVDGDGDQLSVCDVGSYEYLPDQIFVDGFEIGSTDRWSAATP